jgi:hypothetical protein
VQPWHRAISALPGGKTVEISNILYKMKRIKSNGPEIVNFVASFLPVIGLMPFHIFCSNYSLEYGRLVSG